MVISHLLNGMILQVATIGTREKKGAGIRFHLPTPRYDIQDFGRLRLRYI